MAYEFIHLLLEDPKGADALFEYYRAFGAGHLHPAIAAIDADLDVGCLFKDDTCNPADIRPLGLCSILPRLGERCVAMQERGWMASYCTTPLPEHVAEQARLVADTTVALDAARLHHRCQLRLVILKRRVRSLDDQPGPFSQLNFCALPLFIKMLRH